MANKPLKSIKFPGLNDTYTVPEVDNTLAVTGAAADAKKVGDEISDIKADLSNIYETDSFEFLWSNGGISSSNGKDASAANRIRTTVLPDGFNSIYPENGYKFAIAAYNKLTGVYAGFWNGSTYANSITWFETPVSFISITQNYRIRIVGSLKNDTSIDTESAEYFKFDYSRFEMINSQIGNINNLTTDNNNDIVSALNEVSTRAIKNGGMNVFTVPSSGWTRKGVNSETGSSGSNNYRLLTSSYIDEDVLSIKTKTGYEFTVFAYTKSNESYIGCWNGKTFVPSQTTWVNEMQINQSLEYSYLVCMKSTAGDSVSITTSEGVNAEFFFYRTVGEKTLTEGKNANFNLSGINSSTGKNVTVYFNTDLIRIRTGYLDEDVEYVEGSEDYLIAVFAYDSYEVYKGVWQGNGFLIGTLKWLTEIDLRELRDKYNGYLFRIVISRKGDTPLSISDTLSKVKLYGNHAVKESKINLYNYHIENTDLDENGLEYRRSGYITTCFIEIPDRLSLNNYMYDPYHYVNIASMISGLYGDNFSRCCFYSADKSFLASSVASPVETNILAKYIKVSFSSGSSRQFIRFSNNPTVPRYGKHEKRIPLSVIENIPVVISDGALTNMLRVAMQYAYNDSFGYGNTHTAFSESAEKIESDGYVKGDGTMDTDPLYSGEKYQIDCSAFTRLVLQGITPKNSRYFQNVNVVSPCGYVFSEDAKYDNEYGRLTANKQALYAKEHGFLYTVETNFKNVKPGDLLFNSDNNDKDAFFDGISHSLFVTDVKSLPNGERAIYVAEATRSGNSVVTFHEFSHYTNLSYHYGARYMMPFVSSETNPIGVAEASVITPSEGAATLFSITLDNQIKEKDVYTVVFKTDLGTEPDISISVGNTDVSSIISRDNDGLAYLHVFTTDSTLAGESTVTASVANAGNDMIQLYGAKVYRGFVTCGCGII